jgi:hypothetical protein
MADSRPAAADMRTGAENRTSVASTEDTPGSDRRESASYKAHAPRPSQDLPSLKQSPSPLPQTTPIQHLLCT